MNAVKERTEGIPCRGFTDIKPTFNMPGSRALEIARWCVDNQQVSGRPLRVMELMAEHGNALYPDDLAPTLLQFDSIAPHE